MLSLEEQLIRSQLPYPKYYDGYNWNTIIGNTRRHIPQYLHEDLPKLKFEPIREEFKKLNQIECPRLTYFNARLHIHKHPEHKLETKSIPRPQYSEKLIEQLKGIRSQMQYALLTTDKNSNVIKKLIARAAVIEEELALIAKREGKRAQKKKSHSMAAIYKPQKCFNNTLGIVLTARKQQLDHLRSEEKEEIEEIKIKAVLLPYIEQ